MTNRQRCAAARDWQPGRGHTPSAWIAISNWVSRSLVECDHSRQHACSRKTHGLAAHTPLAYGHRMQGSQAVIAQLNALLAGELSAMDLYLLQGRMLGDWGYSKLQERLVHESSDEREHADHLIQRILFLDGKPDVTARVPVQVGDSPKQMLENDLKYELEVAKALNAAMAVCVAEGDNASRELLERLLKDTEQDHILWLQTQLRLMNELGVELYLSEQI